MSSFVSTFAGVRGLSGNTNGPVSSFGRAPIAGFAQAFLTHNLAAAGASGVAAKLNQPFGLAVDWSLGYAVTFVGDRQNVIRGVNASSGQIFTVAGTIGYDAWNDGIATNANFRWPAHLAMGIAGGVQSLYVSDSTNHRIRRMVVSTRAVSTVAGSGTAGYVDGVGANAVLSSPGGLVVDARSVSPILYVADTGNNRIRRIDIFSQTVTTLAGTGVLSRVDGPCGAATFTQPTSVAMGPVDSAFANVLYVADASFTLRAIDLAANMVSTLAGTSGTSALIDGVGVAAAFLGPSALTSLLFSGSPYLFVADANAVRQVALATNAVTTVSGGSVAGMVEGSAAAARYNQLRGIAVHGTNVSAATVTLLLGDSGNHVVRSLTIGMGSQCSPGMCSMHLKNSAVTLFFE